MSRARASAAALVGCVCVCLGAASASLPGLTKYGTVDFQMVETTPVMWHGMLLRMESVRTSYPGNHLGHNYLRFRDIDSGALVGLPFGIGHMFGSAFVHNGTMHVYANLVEGPDSLTTIRCFHTSDPSLSSWDSDVAIKMPPGYQCFNNGVHNAGGGYQNKSFVMAIELGAPAAVVGQRFTSVFATSDDAVTGWQMLDVTKYVWTTSRYSACPTIRYLADEGYYYLLTLYSGVSAGWSFDEFAFRSKDLAAWEASPLNPILTYDAQDRTYAADCALNATEKALSQNTTAAVDANASDMDLIEVNSTYTYITYSWGDQEKYNWLAGAYYKGGYKEFFGAMFPSDAAADAARGSLD